MIAWDYNGKELWRVALGALDSGWFFDPAFQWGHSSSPIIYRNSVILQADVQKGLARRRVGYRDRQAALEDRARRRDLHLGHADHRPHARRPRRARHQRHQGPRLRPSVRQAAAGRSGRTRRSRSARRSPATGSSTSPAATRRCVRSTPSVPVQKATSRCRRDRSRTSRSRGATCRKERTSRRPCCTTACSSR